MTRTLTGLLALALIALAGCSGSSGHSEYGDKDRMYHSGQAHPVSMEEKLQQIDLLFDNTQEAIVCGSLGGRAKNEIIVGFTPTISADLGLNGKARTSFPWLPSYADMLPRPELTQPSRSCRASRAVSAAARFIATQHGLHLRREFHNGKVAWAVFVCPSDQDDKVIARDILLSHPGIVESVEPNMLGILPSYFPRGTFPYIDRLPDFGDEGVERVSGCEPSHNGPAFWNDGQDSTSGPDSEAYNYFQVNAHRSHASYFGGGEHVIGPQGPGLGCRVFVIDTGVIPDHPRLPVVPDNPLITPPAILQPRDPSGTDPAYWDVTTDRWENLDDAYRSETSPPQVRCHGTKSAGVIASRGGAPGMLPLGQVIPFKIWTAGNPHYSDVDLLAEAINRAFMVRDVYSCYDCAVVMTFRYSGTTTPPPILQQTMDSIAGDPRFTLVVAAHNYNEPVIRNAPSAHSWWPTAYAADPVYGAQVISVMAVDRSDIRSQFSNYAIWPYLDATTVSAPGGGGQQDMTPFYGYLSTGVGESGDPASWFGESGGTSQATPHVAALSAFIRQYAQRSGIGLLSGQIKEHIVETSRQTTWNGGSLYNYTKPIVDFSRALPWIDVTDPAYNPNDPAWGLPPLWERGGTSSADVTLEAKVYIAPGFADEGSVFVTFHLALEDSVFPSDIILGVDTDFQSGEDYDSDYQSQSATVTVDLDQTRFDFMHGPAAVWATVDTPTLPSKVVSRRVPIHLQ